MPGESRYQIAIDSKVDEELSASLSEVIVTEHMRKETTFTVRFAIDICGDDMELLDDERLVPGKDRKLAVLVTVDNETSVLVNGIITDRKCDLKDGGPGSSLEVKGSDRRVEMSRNGASNAVLQGPAFSIVTSILTSYDFKPDVERGDTRLYSEEKGTMNQTGSDLDLVNKMAREVGYEFWIDSKLSPGFGSLKIQETAHFKEVPKQPTGGAGLGIPIPVLAPAGAPVLSINTGDGKSTMLSFSSERASEVPTGGGAISRIDALTGRVEKTDVREASKEPLGNKPPSPRSIRPIVTPGDAQEARRRQTAAVNDASWTISANAKTSVHALGSLIRTRDVVTVKGAGKVDDGDYLVWSVTHSIDAADHHMELEMRRNAVGN